MEPGSPFDPGIQALVIHLHLTQAISFERLSEMMKAIFGLEISEGAIANTLQRALKPMLTAAEAIGALVLAGDDESIKTWQTIAHRITELSTKLGQRRGNDGSRGYSKSEATQPNIGPSTDGRKVAWE